MSDNKQNVEPELPAFVKKAPELIPLWDWWVKEGKSTLTILAVVALGIAAVYGVRNWRKARAEAASNAVTRAYDLGALQNAFGTEELEQDVADYGASKGGAALKLRLAMSYYEKALANGAGTAENEDLKKALALYDEIVKAGNPSLVDIAQVGRAYVFEAMSDYAKAREAYLAYAEAPANKESYLLLTAQLGVIRCKGLAGDKAGAAKDFDALKEATKDEMAKRRIEQMANVTARFDAKRMTPPSMEDAIKAAAAAAAVEAKKAEAAKVEADKKEAPAVKPPVEPAKTEVPAKKEAPAKPAAK